MGGGKGEWLDTYDVFKQTLNQYFFELPSFFMQSMTFSLLCIFSLNLRFIIMKGLCIQLSDKMPPQTQRLPCTNINNNTFVCVCPYRKMWIYWTWQFPSKSLNLKIAWILIRSEMFPVSSNWKQSISRYCQYIQYNKVHYRYNTINFIDKRFFVSVSS